MELGKSCLNIWNKYCRNSRFQALGWSMNHLILGFNIFRHFTAAWWGYTWRNNEKTYGRYPMYPRQNLKFDHFWVPCEICCNVGTSTMIQWLVRVGTFYAELFFGGIPWQFSRVSKSNWEILNIPIGSMVLLYMVTWIPSIYPLYVSIYTSTMDPMG